ncbi:hypothetical protein, partial [Hydrogenivirga sp. 128-5-R1-1]|uniref:hypothetical protein n=1 Tax=Hydrogenivirga sp. 128-5-R1-1 TaxID=392423 RepID=UPI00015F108A
VVNIPLKNTNVSNKKYYIMYFATMPSLKEIEKIKHKYEKILDKKFYVLKVKDGKYYAVALLYTDKEKAKKDLNKFRNILRKKDIFFTGKPYKIDIVEY